MTDVVLQRDSELMVVLVQSQTERGQEFVDAHEATPMVVLDSGRIILNESGANLLAAFAAQEGISIKRENIR